MKTAATSWVVVVAGNVSRPLTKECAGSAWWRHPHEARCASVAGAACEVCSTTAPSGVLVPPPVRDLEVLRDEVMAVRYCPLHEVEGRVMRLALRIANAEGIAWELQHGGSK